MVQVVVRALVARVAAAAASGEERPRSRAPRGEARHGHAMTGRAWRAGQRGEDGKAGGPPSWPVRRRAWMRKRCLSRWLDSDVMRSLNVAAPARARAHSGWRQLQRAEVGISACRGGAAATLQRDDVRLADEQRL